MWTQIIADLVNAGWSQTEIATRCNTTQATISRLANGDTKNPTYPTARELERLHRNLKARQARVAAACSAWLGAFSLMRLALSFFSGTPRRSQISPVHDIIRST